MMNKMINSLKTYIQTRSRLYNLALKLYMRIRWLPLSFSKLQFYYCMMTNQPFFGLWLYANQVASKRHVVMLKLINAELEKHKGSTYKILEIGSWAGSSAILWASACKKKKKGVVFCIDTWKGALNYSRDMKRATKKIFHLFLHNVRVSGLEDYIIPIKTTSDRLIHILKNETFDFVYIDGDHAYKQFKRDLLNYLPVVKENGVICGDDLELNPNEINIQNAKNHCEEDFILDTKSNQYFHLGIALGIKDVFGSVSMSNGFWAMRKFKGGWRKLVL